MSQPNENPQIRSAFNEISRRLFLGGAAGAAVGLATHWIPLHKALSPTLYMGYLSQLNGALAHYVLPQESAVEIVGSIFNLKNAMRALLVGNFSLDGLSDAERNEKIDYIIQKTYAELAKDLTSEDVKIIHSVHHNPLVRGMREKAHQMGKIVSLQMSTVFYRTDHELIFLAIIDGQLDRLAPFKAGEVQIVDENDRLLKDWMDLSVNVNLKETAKIWCTQICQRREPNFSPDSFADTLESVSAFMEQIVKNSSFEAIKKQTAPEDIRAVHSIFSTPNYSKYLKLGWYFDRNLYGITTKFMKASGSPDELSPIS